MKPSWPALPDQAGIDCEAFAADVIFGYAARHRRREQPAQQMTCVGAGS